jgi:hypothetical protein
MTLSATPSRLVAASAFSEIFAFSDAALRPVDLPTMLKAISSIDGSA